MSVKNLVLIVGIVYIGVDSYLIPPLTSFSKELTFFDRRLTLSSSFNIITENDSFIYAICNSQEKTFKENKCNVTIETPAFENATYKETCLVHIGPNNPWSFEVMTKLRLYQFGDDKVLLSWLVKDADFHTNVAKVRILHWLNCEYNDVLVPGDMIFDIITYDSFFDVVISNRTMCASDYCRITYDVNGKKISGPALIAPKMKIASLETIVSVFPRSPTKGFYLLTKDNKNSDHFNMLHADQDGKAVELMKIKGNGNVKISNAHDTLSVCSTIQANITCWQYNGNPNMKMETIRFFDSSEQEFIRWMHPYNLADHGLLIVSGLVNIHNQPRFESFSITKIQPDGHHERPLHIGGLNFKCTSIPQFFVSVSENDEDEICVHFICDGADFDRQGIRNTLKFSTKCLPKKYLTMGKRKTSKLN